MTSDPNKSDYVPPSLYTPLTAPHIYWTNEQYIDQIRLLVERTKALEGWLKQKEEAYVSVYYENQRLKKHISFLQNDIFDLKEELQKRNGDTSKN